MMRGPAALLLFRLAALLCLPAFAPSALAAGTQAGTVVTSTAVIDYQIAGTNYTGNAVSSFTVHERLEVNLVWQDAANVQAPSPGPSTVVSFLLTNTGNGSEQFLLSADGSVGGDDFDFAAAGIQIWIDDGDNAWQPVNDTLYNGSNGPVLNGASPADDAVTVFVVADAPPGQPAGALGNLALTAVSATADAAGETGNTGAQISGGGDGGVDAIVGLSGAAGTAIGTVEVIAGGVSIAKSVQVTDAQGGDVPHTGATLRYTLQINVFGSSPVDNLIITDPIPANTTYVPGSITLDSTAQTDAADAPADYADFNGTNANTVTVDLSRGATVSITPPATFTIEFSVTID